MLAEKSEGECRKFRKDQTDVFKHVEERIDFESEHKTQKSDVCDGF